MARAKDEFDQASDSTRLFLKERVEECSPYEEIDRTDLYAAYKDWCALNRLNPVSAHRLYNSVWDIFRVKTHKRQRTQAVQGHQFVSEDAEATQSGAESGRCGRSSGRFNFAKVPLNSQSWTESPA